MKSQKPIDTVIYYHPDLDGTTAAAVVKKKELLLLPTLSIVCKKFHHGQPIQDPPRAITTYAVDSTLSQADYDLLVRRSQTVFWIDHHRTNYKDVIKRRDADVFVLSDEHAACRLAWDFLFPANPPPLPVLLADDYDLWKFEMGDFTRYFEALFEVELNDVDLMCDLLEKGVDTQAIVSRGRDYYNARMKAVEQAAKKGYERWLGDYKIYLVNHTAHVSELGHFILDLGYDIAWMWAYRFISGRLYIVNHLRSERVNVAEIAKRYGGGGLPAAAGFAVPAREPDELISLCEKEAKE